MPWTSASKCALLVFCASIQASVSISFSWFALHRFHVKGKPSRYWLCLLIMSPYSKETVLPNETKQKHEHSADWQLYAFTTMLCLLHTEQSQVRTIKKQRMEKEHTTKGRSQCTRLSDRCISGRLSEHNKASKLALHCQQCKCTVLPVWNTVRAPDNFTREMVAFEIDCSTDISVSSPSLNLTEQ